MRKLVSISCLLLLCSSWAATAQARQVTDTNVSLTNIAATSVESTVDTGNTVEPVKTIDAVQKAQPLPAVPPVSFKVDLTGTSIPAPNSDDEAVARALKQYDESMRTWSLPPEKLNEIARSSRVTPPQDGFRLYRKDDFYSPRTSRELEWSRQRFADRVADSIYPGFGRVERSYSNGTSSRLDYIYTRRCGGRGGLGVCYQYRF